MSGSSPPDDGGGPQRATTPPPLPPPAAPPPAPSPSSDYWNTRKWAKWANALFKRDKPLGSEPWFNPEAVTEQKREWLEQQQRTQMAHAASWPQHIYESFCIVGLPPDMELTQVAEQLCELERRKQRSESADADADHQQQQQQQREPGGKEHQQPPQPSFTAQVLYRSPAGVPAPISDEEVAALAFPSGVTPEKLRRTPSLSALDELVMGRDSEQQQQCFVFMLKVGGNFPLYGCCWYVREMLHRPPYLARGAFRSCRAPFRQCMIAAPRCYCLLSHYPFFDLHFRVLKIVLDLERLERLLEYDSEKSRLRPPPGLGGAPPGSPSAAAAAAAPAAATAAGPSASTRRRSLPLQDASSAGASAPGSLAGSRSASPAPGSFMHAAARLTRASSADAGAGGGGGSATGGGAASAAAPAALCCGSSTGAGDEGADVVAHVMHNRQQYCHECAGILEDMCPFTPGAGDGGTAAAAAADLLQRRRRRSPSPLGGGGSSQQPQQPQQPNGQQAQPSDSGQLPSLFCTGQQQQQQQDDDEEPGVRLVASVRCEVCGKPLRESGTPPMQQQGSSAAADAASADSTQHALSALPARLMRLQTAGSSTGSTGSTDGGGRRCIAPSGPAQQLEPAGSSGPAAPTPATPPPAQSFDAVAAAAGEFDAAARPAAAAAAASSGGDGWRAGGALDCPGGSAPQPVVLPGGKGPSRGGTYTQQQLLADSGIIYSSSAPSHETSLVQRMWEMWAPHAPEGGTPSGELAGAGSMGGLSGSLGFFRRTSRASGSLAEQQQHLGMHHSSSGSRVSSPAQLQERDGLPAAASGSGPLQADSASELLQQDSLQEHCFEQQQHVASGLHQHASGSHGPSRLGRDPSPPPPPSPPPSQARDGPADGASGPSHAAAAAWQADPSLRPLASYARGDEQPAMTTSGGAAARHTRNLSAISDASSFYTAVDAPDGDDSSPQRAASPAAAGAATSTAQQQQQRQVASHPPLDPQQLELEQLLQEDHASHQQQPRPQPRHLRRQPSPPPVRAEPQQPQRRKHRWSDPSASWPNSRSRTPSPPLLGLMRQGSARRRASDSAGSTPSPPPPPAGDTLVSAFASIAAAAEPFESLSQANSGPPSRGASAAAPRPSASGSLADLRSNSNSSASSCSSSSSRQGSVDAAGGGSAAWLTGGHGGGGGGDDDHHAAAGGGGGGGGARVNVTIGGTIPASSDSSAGKQQQQPQQAALKPVTSSGSQRSSSGRKSAMFEEVALRRSGDMSSELRTTISHLVQVDSGALLAAYHASPVPQPGETYRLMLGDLYRLEFERGAPLADGLAPPGRTRLLQEPLSYAEAECAQQLQLWTVAALCRALSVDSIVALLSAALLERQLVVFCPHIGTLGSVVLALVPLLRPFAWQSLMMPVTPVGMYGFLDAPVPFVLGVQFKTPDVAARCQGLVRVNVYKDAVKAPGSQPPLPGARALAAALTPHHAALRDAAPLAVERPVHVLTPDEEAAARRLLAAAHAHLAGLCGDLRLHTIVNVGMAARTGVLMRDSLLEALPPRDRPFMRAFTETQMFAAYADGVISDACGD